MILSMTNKSKVSSKTFGKIKKSFGDMFEEAGEPSLASSVRASNSSDLEDKQFIKALKLGHPDQATQLEALYEEVVRIKQEGKEDYNPEQYFKFENGVSKFFPNLLAEDIERDYEFKVLRDNEKIYVYREGYYQDLGQDVIEEECDKRLGDKIEPSYQNKVVKIIKRRNKIDRYNFQPPKKRYASKMVSTISEKNNYLITTPNTSSLRKFPGTTGLTQKLMISWTF